MVFCFKMSPICLTQMSKNVIAMFLFFDREFIAFFKCTSQNHRVCYITCLSIFPSLYATNYRFLFAAQMVNTLWLVKKQLYIKMSPISSKMFIFLTPIKKKTQTTLNAAYPLLEPSVALLLQLKSAKRLTSIQKISNKPNLKSLG